MAATPWIEVGARLRIPKSEITYGASRSGGPGGQHVNTSSTRIELWWNLEVSTALTDEQRIRIRTRLTARLDTEGWLRLVESGSRSQLRNKETVTERFSKLLMQALRPPKTRRPTRVPQTQKLKRLESKKLRGGVKRLRGKVRGDE